MKEKLRLSTVVSILLTVWLLQAGGSLTRENGLRGLTGGQANEGVGGGYLGISLGDRYVDPRLQLSGTPTVMAVNANGPAAKAGFREGDVIMAIDKVPVGSTREVTARIAAMIPGTQVHILILRAGQLLTLTVTLGSRPAGAENPPVGQFPPGNVEQGTGLTSGVAGTFRVVQTADRVVTVAIPSDWAASGTFERFVAFSTRGESFGSGRAEVWPDEQALRRGLAVLPPTLMSPQELALVSRSVAPPLVPLDVIRLLYPQLAGGAIQSMHVLDTRPLFSQRQLGAALIHYRYTLLPHRDSAFQSLLPPALQAQTQVPMEGAALIMTFPLAFDPALVANFPDLAVANVWSYVYRLAEAPDALFIKNVATYAKIFATYRVDLQALNENYRQQQQVFEQMNEQTQETGRQWILTLGNEGEYNSHEHPEPRITERKTCSGGTELYICGSVLQCYTGSQALQRGCEKAYPVPH